MSSNVRAMSLPRSQNYVGGEHDVFVSVCRVRKTWLLFSDSHWTGWLHSASGTQLLPDIQSRTVYPESAETADMTFFAKSWKTHAHISRSSRFVCRMHSSNLGIDVVAYSASAAVKEFTERLTGSSLRKKSGSEFFGVAKKSVQR